MLHKQRGILNMIALLILLVLSMIILTYMQSSATQLNSVHTFENTFTTYYNSESGFEMILNKLKQNVLYEEVYPQEFTTCPEDPQAYLYTSELNGGTYEVCFKELERNVQDVDTNNDGVLDTTKVIDRTVYIVSTGKYEDMKSQIKAKVMIKNIN